MSNFINTEFDVTHKILETKRLILRPWRLSDAADFFEYASETKVSKMAGWLAHKNLEHTKGVLFSFLLSGNVYAIVLKSNHKVIGSIGVEELYINHLGNEFSKLKGRELGYALSMDYWGQGLMPEAVNKVIEYIFDELDFDFLMCAHFEGNNQSESVIKKTGFNLYAHKTISTLFNQSQNTLIYVKYNPHRSYLNQDAND